MAKAKHPTRVTRHVDHDLFLYRGGLKPSLTPQQARDYETHYLPKKTDFHFAYWQNDQLATRKTGHVGGVEAIRMDLATEMELNTGAHPAKYDRGLTQAWPFLEAADSAHPNRPR